MWISDLCINKLMVAWNQSKLIDSIWDLATMGTVIDYTLIIQIAHLGRYLLSDLKIYSSILSLPNWIVWTVQHNTLYCIHISSNILVEMWLWLDLSRGLLLWLHMLSRWYNVILVSSQRYSYSLVKVERILQLLLSRSSYSMAINYSYSLREFLHHHYEARFHRKINSRKRTLVYCEKRTFN